MGKSYKEKKARAKKAKVEVTEVIEPSSTPVVTLEPGVTYQIGGGEISPKTEPEFILQAGTAEAEYAAKVEAAYPPVTGTWDDYTNCTVPQQEPRRAGFFERGFDRLKRWFDLNMPRIVWPNDEVDVRLTFTSDSETLYSIPQWYDDVTKPAEAREFGSVKAAIALGESGVHFDTGTGFYGSDWFLDQSLRGPLRVKFVRKTKNTLARM